MGLVQLVGQAKVDFEAEAGLQHPVILGAIDGHDQVPLVMVHLPGFKPDSQVVNHLPVGIVGPHHPGPLILGLGAGGQWAFCRQMGAGRQQAAEEQDGNDRGQSHMSMLALHGKDLRW